VNVNYKSNNIIYTWKFIGRDKVSSIDIA